jgi:hypothetical protein
MSKTLVVELDDSEFEAIRRVAQAAGREPQEWARTYLLQLLDATSVNGKTLTNQTSALPTRFHWEQTQAIQDGYAGSVADELLRQRRKE